MNKLTPLFFSFFLFAFSLSAQEIQFDTITVKKGKKYVSGYNLYFAYQFIYPATKNAPLTKIKESLIKVFFNNNAHYGDSIITRNIEDARKEYERRAFREFESEDEPGTYGNLRVNDERYSAIKIINEIFMIDK